MSVKNKFMGIVVLVIIAGTGAIFYFYILDVPEENMSEIPEKSVIKTPNPESISDEQKEKTIGWDYDGEKWYAIGDPPLCPEPLILTTPGDMDKVSAMLYPGQERGGGYSPHGGFRFDGAGNNISVIAPMDAQLWRGSRHITNGEIQYSLDFIAPCGIWYRVDHLRILSPRFAALVDTLPQPKENDSRTTVFPSGTHVTVGETIATSIGFINNGNSFFDFGVYDLRQKNEISRDPEWAATHNIEQGHYAVCWFNWLPAEDAALAWQLPTGIEGTVSDYCKK